MKKKLFSILLSLAMVITMMPAMTMTAFAAGHDITVEKASGEAATDGVDYSWNSDELTISGDNLVISGTTTTEYINIDDSVSKITLDNLSITLSGVQMPTCISTSESRTEQLEIVINNDNYLSATGTMGGFSIATSGNLEISGSGSLSANGSGTYMGMGLNLLGELTLSNTGNLIITGSNVGIACAGLNVNPPIGKVIARGGYIAADCLSEFTLNDGIVAYGSDDKDASEDNINDTISIIYIEDTPSFYTFSVDGETSAKAVLITQASTSNWSILSGAMAGEDSYLSVQTITDEAEENPTNLFSVVDETEGSETTRTITLLSDITATAADSALTVPAGKKVVLDLNGHMLDRNLIADDGTPTIVDCGSVIGITEGGDLTIKDSAPNEEHKLKVVEKTINDGFDDFTIKIGVLGDDGDITIKGGVITGGTGNKDQNVDDHDGGGIYNYEGILNIMGGSIIGNYAPSSGGGVMSFSPSDDNETFIMSNGSISYNYSSAGAGAAIATNSPFVMNGGEIKNNVAGFVGGGVTNVGEFTMNGGLISNNSVLDETSGLGGGVSNYITTMHMNGGTISNNSATNGGGVGFDTSGYLYMNGGTISNNSATNGGGVYTGMMGMFFLYIKGGAIMNNSATTSSGGIFSSSFGVLGGKTKIIGNTVSSGAGTSTASNYCCMDLSYTYVGTGDEISDTIYEEPYTTPITLDPIDEPTNGMMVGVTRISSIDGTASSGQFTHNGTSDDMKFFFSDSPNYYVNFVDADSDYLELKAPTEGNYAINVIQGEHGTVHADKQFAPSSATVTLTVTPDSGYELDTLTYTPFGESVVDITTSKSFTMPAKAVTVTATFKESTEPGPTPGPTPEPTPAEEYTIPVEGENTVQTGATIENGKAKVQEITESTLQEVVNPKSGTETTDTIIIDLSQAKQDVTAVELTKKTVENLADVVTSDKNAIETVTIQMKEATVELDAKTLEAVSQQADGNSIVLVVDKTQSEKLEAAKQETLKDYNVNKTFEAYFESNGHRIHDFKGGIATVSIKFEPTQGSDISKYKIYYLDDNAKMHKYATKYKDGMLKFATTHFSDYVIVYDGNTDVLLMQAKTSGKKAIKLSWNGIDNATKYVVYGAKCGNNFKMLKTVKGKSYTVKKIAGKKLKAHKPYKFYVVAYDAVGNKVQSRSIHHIYKNTQSKYANVKSIKAKYDELLLSVGVTQKIGAKYKMYFGKKHLKKAHGVALRYTSNNPDVATVSSAGTVKAVGKGTATIYIQDIGGKYCKTKVTVE